MTRYLYPDGKCSIIWEEGDPVDWVTPNVGDGIDDEYCGNCGWDSPGCGCPRDPRHPDYPAGWPATRRAWIVMFPPGTEVLTANDRTHRFAAAAVTKQLRAEMKQLAVQVHKLPPLERAEITLEYQPPPRLLKDRHPLHSARVEDSDALYPTRKALVDGLAEAGVLPRGDSRKRVGDARCRLLPGTHPRGQLRLVITELTGGAAR